jgi:hypothetical protein
VCCFPASGSTGQQSQAKIRATAKRPGYLLPILWRSIFQRIKPKLTIEDAMKKSSSAQNSWIFQSQNREGLAPDEVKRLEEIRAKRKAKNWKLDPNRY